MVEEQRAARLRLRLRSHPPEQRHGLVPAARLGLGRHRRHVRGVMHRPQPQRPAHLGRAGRMRAAAARAHLAQLVSLDSPELAAIWAACHVAKLLEGGCGRAARPHQAHHHAEGRRRSVEVAEDGRRVQVAGLRGIGRRRIGDPWPGLTAAPQPSIWALRSSAARPECVAQPGAWRDRPQETGAVRRGMAPTKTAPSVCGRATLLG